MTNRLKQYAALSAAAPARAFSPSAQAGTSHPPEGRNAGVRCSEYSHFRTVTWKPAVISPNPLEEPKARHYLFFKKF